MQKRRERIEKWRAERKKKEISEGVTSTANVILPSVKKWTLEDDDEDDNIPPVEIEKNDSEEKPEKKEIKEEKMETEEEDDVDPLDAFMQVGKMNKERNFNQVNNKTISCVRFFFSLCCLHVCFCVPYLYLMLVFFSLISFCYCLLCS